MLNLYHVVSDCGPVQMNAQFAERMMRHPSTWLVLMAATFYSFQPMVLTLFPLLVFEMVHLCVWCYNAASMSAVGVARGMEKAGNFVMPK